MVTHATPARCYWEATATDADVGYAPLAANLDVDVAVVGAGIVGLTAARQLVLAGKSVAVLEGLQVGMQATGRSTAKITSQHGLIYNRLIHDYGEDSARVYAKANEFAIAYIARLVNDLHIDCAFEHKAAYIYAQSEHDMLKIEEEAHAAVRLGLPARLTTEIPAALPVVAALCFDGQAQFHPVRYLRGLAAYLAQHAQIFEHTRAMQIKKGIRSVVRTEAGHTVTAQEVIVATHLPIVQQGMFFTKAFTISHPMMAAPIDPATMPDGMFISSGQPSFSFRVDKSGGAPQLIAVGPAYKTGVADDEARSTHALAHFMKETFGIERSAYSWTNEDYESMDGLPFVGRASSATPSLYVATGFNAWGISNGTMAGCLLADLILERDNPAADLFDATRINPVQGGVEFMKENLLTAQHFVGDRFLTNRPKEFNVPAGEAVIGKRNGESVAVYRDESGMLHQVSAVCTHMGCVVGWNATDRTWDCPCHGSRFDVDGAVVHGPATKALKIVGP
ncbi:MAG TPA: FAD-dependent oxidoreductase [Candidimonas sp.]|nr:FAD-dependent oxidoreductase [Candidimonas sp.]